LMGEALQGTLEVVGFQELGFVFHGRSNF